ncbi:hypothetical protein [Cohaesibacter celericrescens]|uniref:DUF2244 domain-containing protein n=1 Tax=Cohaesibacter celericrescens TaxID=2067669 RepID=A0A2N5XKA6_9HYPH|nr:hypothetical protein [Cohaesibacter celericrescens]PLW74953.1 hypothetical protein C0081_21865 [Cohaesibacter celericrescens]
MTKSNVPMPSVRNHLSPIVRVRKGVISAALMGLALFLLFGPRLEGDNMALTMLLLAVAFIAFGFGWVGLSQGVMGWSRQVDFDFDKNEVRQTSASIFGRSKPFVVPFNKIANFEVKVGPVAGEGGLEDEAMIELQDGNGRTMIRAGMFDTRSDADAIVSRIGKALTMAHKKGKS